MLDGNPVREITVDITDPQGRQGVMKGRVFLAEGRPLQVMAVAPSGELNTAEATDFVESFRVLSK